MFVKQPLAKPEGLLIMEQDFCQCSGHHISPIGCKEHNKHAYEGHERDLHHRPRQGRRHGCTEKGFRILQNWMSGMTEGHAREKQQCTAHSGTQK